MSAGAKGPTAAQAIACHVRQYLEYDDIVDSSAVEALLSPIKLDWYFTMLQ